MATEVSPNAYGLMFLGLRVFFCLDQMAWIRMTFDMQFLFYANARKGRNTTSTGTNTLKYANFMPHRGGGSIFL